MAAGMADYSGEAARCLLIKNEVSGAIFRRGGFPPTIWLNMYSSAKLHPQDMHIEMESRNAPVDTSMPYSESELKALSLPKLIMIAEAASLTPDGTKSDLIKRIMDNQSEITWKAPQ